MIKDTNIAILIVNYSLIVSVKIKTNINIQIKIKIHYMLGYILGCIYEGLKISKTMMVKINAMWT